MNIAGVEISHPDKIIFPKENITKLQMVQYYEEVANKMLPYMHNRPLTLQRFPNGVNHDGFFQKNASDYFPDFIKTIKIKTEEGSNTQILCNSKKALIYLANQGTIVFHIWLSKKDKLYKPDKVVFDLDPSNNSFDEVKEAARLVGEYFREKGKNPQLMTTGQNGLHVWYKIRRTKTFDELHDTFKKDALELEEKYPDLFTTAIRKNQRQGKIFVDYLRNSYAQTSVCPYSLRANSQAGIAMPINWNDLGNLTSADAYTISNFS